MSDKDRVDVHVEPLPTEEKPVAYCLPTDPRHLALIILSVYELPDVLKLHEGLTYALNEIAAAHSGPTSPLEIN